MGRGEGRAEGRQAWVGQGLVEYALVLALVAIVAIVALLFLGGAVSAVLSRLGASI